MHKVKQYLFIFILAVIVVTLGIYIALINARSDSDGICLKRSVPNSDAAVSIAQLVCKSYTDIDVEAEAFVPEYDAEQDIWKVRLKCECDFDDTHNFWFKRCNKYIMPCFFRQVGLGSLRKMGKKNRKGRKIFRRDS